MPFDSHLPEKSYTGHYKCSLGVLSQSCMDCREWSAFKRNMYNSFKHLGSQHPPIHNLCRINTNFYQRTYVFIILILG
jgi:hypothetical protein